MGATLSVLSEKEKRNPENEKKEIQKKKSPGGANPHPKRFLI